MTQFYFKWDGRTGITGIIGITMIQVLLLLDVVGIFNMFFLTRAQTKEYVELGKWIILLVYAVNVEGSADINNNSTYNADLAKRRADKVVQILETGPKPVKPEQIIKTSTGETNSTQTNESEKYKDRKVTIEINYPKKCE
jgi:hypothetical protein